MKVRIQINDVTGVNFFFEGIGSVFYRLDHFYRFAESLGYVFDAPGGLKAYNASNDVKFYFDPVRDARRPWVLKDLTKQLILPVAIGNYFDVNSNSQTIEIVSYENTLEKEG